MSGNATSKPRFSRTTATREATKSDHRGDGRVLSFAGARPRVHRDAWLAPGCIVVGDVQIGAGSSIWYGTVVRGDVNSIRIGARTNLQDQCTVHVTRDRFPVVIGDEVSVGHRAVVHGCTVGNGVLIGIGAIVLDGAEIAEGALIGAGALVTPGTRIPPATLALGVPAKVVRDLSDDELEIQRERTLSYVETARTHAKSVDEEAS